MAYDDVEAEVDADFDIFKNQIVSHLAYKWQEREAEWLEPAAVCRPFNSPRMCKHVSTGFPYIMHFTNVLGVSGIMYGNLLCHAGLIQWHLIERGRGIVPLIGIVLHSVSARPVRKSTEGTRMK
jgi:hypothetical protein